MDARDFWVRRTRRRYCVSLAPCLAWSSPETSCGALGYESCRGQGAWRDPPESRHEPQDTYRPQRVPCIREKELVSRQSFQGE